MDVVTRVKICRLIEKINRSPEYAKRITVKSNLVSPVHIEREG